MESLEINPHTYGQLISDKGGKKKKRYNGEKIDSSINGAGNTRELHVKNEIRKSPNIIHKNLK